MVTIQRAVNKLIAPVFRSNAALTRLLVSCFIVLGLIGIINHEMWRDELQAWMIARDSSSMVDLFKNLRYEGHPGLWHTCLYLISRFTHNPIAMQLFHLIIATGAVYVFIKYSPFKKSHKFLFCFGYFPFYEYSIISRNYSLGVLLIFLFCQFYSSLNKSYLILSIILSLLVNTNIYGLIIAFCLGMTLVVEIHINESLTRILSTRRAEIIISLIIFTFGIALALIQMLPPADSRFEGDWGSTFTEYKVGPLKVKRFALTLMAIWKSYIPIPNFFSYSFWGTNILADGPGVLKACAILFSIGILFFSSIMFIRKPAVLFLYLSGTAGILLLTYTKFLGYVRQYGYLFILFVACLWISSYCTKSDFLAKPIKKLINTFNKYNTQYFTVLLCTHFIAGIYSFSIDIVNPFSASKAVASFIEGHQISQALIVGSRDNLVSPVTGLLDRKVYYPESDRFGSFIIWNNQRKDINSQELIDKINKLLTEKNKNILLILSEKLDVYRPDLSISELTSFSQSIVPSETYHLYLIQKPSI
jgi:hypothetical protein